MVMVSKARILLKEWVSRLAELLHVFLALFCVCFCVSFVQPDISRIRTGHNRQEWLHSPRASKRSPPLSFSYLFRHFLTSSPPSPVSISFLMRGPLSNTHTEHASFLQGFLSPSSIHSTHKKMITRDETEIGSFWTD